MASPVPPREVLPRRAAHAAQLRRARGGRRRMILYPAIDIMDGQAVRLVEGVFEDATTYHADPLGRRPLLGRGRRALPARRRPRRRPLRRARSRSTTCAGSSPRPASRSSTAAACAPSRPSARRCAPAPSARSSAPPPSRTSTSSTTSSPPTAPRIVVAVDIKDGMIATEGWTQTTQLPVVDAIQRLTSRGVRSFVFTDVSRDGKLTGPDLEAVQRRRRRRPRALHLLRRHRLARPPALAGQAAPGEHGGRDRRQVALREEVHRGRGPGRARRRLDVHYKRVIPCMDVDNGRVVKGTRFIDIRDAGDPVELAAHYDAQGADELVFLDITATSDKRATVVELARRAADDVFVPFTIGGGVREVAGRARGAGRGRGQGLDQLRGARPARADRRARAGLRRAVRGAGDRRQAAPGRHATRPTWPAGARRRARTPSSGRARASSAARARSCSPAWTATAPRTATS